MIYIVSLQASFPVFSPKKKKNQRKRRNKITLVSPYTLSNMFSYYVYKIRKLCPFLHYWVINLSSLSGSPVKPSSKMNYGCRQQSGACMSLFLSVCMCRQTNLYVCIHVCLYTLHIPLQMKNKTACTGLWRTRLTTEFCTTHLIPFGVYTSWHPLRFCSLFSCIFDWCATQTTLNFV